jgi:hypothetical protein
MGSPTAQALVFAGLRRIAPRCVPPSFAAHMPAGEAGRPQRADGYYRVVASWRWPWWWPGGGVDWRIPGA